MISFLGTTCFRSFCYSVKLHCNNNSFSNDLMKMEFKYIELIKKYTCICRNHLTPEIKLHLITPGSQLWIGRSDESPFSDPFWAFYWPGGQVLSRYILDNNNVVKNISVLDIGCGCGACSISAAMSNAREVIANDIDIVACIATKLNADMNFVQLKLNQENLIGRNISSDCVLVGDMFYNEEFANELFDWLYNLKKSGKVVLLGDPGRHAFKIPKIQKHLKLLRSYSLPQNVQNENNGFTDACVWTII